MRRGVAAACLVLALAGIWMGVGSAFGQVDPKLEGRIGPQNRIQPSGRLLNPYGKLTQLGNHPGGGALTTDGRFLWTLSAGRGPNDIRIVKVDSNVPCRKPKKRRGGSRRANRLRKLGNRRFAACKRRRTKEVSGQVIQTIPMPGVTGGIVMSSDGSTAYVSGSPESSHKGQKVDAAIPGRKGDAIHVFKLDPNTGQAARDGVINVPPPAGAPLPQISPLGLPGTAGIPQNFPPTSTTPISWPRELALSADGKTLVAALNLVDNAAIVDTASRRPRYVRVGSYPYGAGITKDGKRAFVSNEADGTVSVIDTASGNKVKDIQVGPHLSHPQAIAMDPNASRAYVAVANQDVIAVLDTDKLTVERTLSVSRPEGIGTSPVDLSVSPDGTRLLVANSGEDAVAIFKLPGAEPATPKAKKKKKKKKRTKKRRSSGARGAADSILAHEEDLGEGYSESSAEEAEEIAEAYAAVKRGEDPDEAEEEEAEEAARKKKKKKKKKKKPTTVSPVSKDFELIGRVPVGSYPVEAFASPSGKLVWIAAKGLGVGANPNGPNPTSTKNNDDGINAFEYLPLIVRGTSGIGGFPSADQIRQLTPQAAQQSRPVNDQPAPPDTPIKEPSQGGKIKHVFYVVRENRTYDQVLGDDPRGDGDPNLTLFPESVTPNAHALAKRFPLLDHVYANSEASIDGHFWTSAGAVSDYVVKNWHQNYGGRQRPYDFGVYAVTWPSQRFLFDQAEKQGISYTNFGEAIAGTVPLTDKDRNAQETQEVAAKFAKSDLGAPEPAQCFANDASSGGTDVVYDAATGRARNVEVYDSSLPAGVTPEARSRFDCFNRKFQAQLAGLALPPYASAQHPAFTYITLPDDHTAGTKPGARTPRAMVAENDYALGQLVETISKSRIWKDSLIMVIEDDSQDGADHVDAHRIPAFAISPYAKRGAVVHTRYDFLSFIRTMEIGIGMKPLNLFDATAVPMYDTFSPNPDNSEAYTAIRPGQNLTERNTAASPNARLSKKLDIGRPDTYPQRLLDKILWQSVHGKNSKPPPPGPNASGVDEANYSGPGKHHINGGE